MMRPLLLYLETLWLRNENASLKRRLAAMEAGRELADRAHFEGGYRAAEDVLWTWIEEARGGCGEPPLPPDHPKIKPMIEIVNALRQARDVTVAMRYPPNSPVHD